MLSVLDTAGGKSVFAWGKNHYGVLGSGKKPTVSVPAPAELPNGDPLILRVWPGMEVQDLRGNIWRNAKVVQRVVVGDADSTVLYWSLA